MKWVGRSRARALACCALVGAFARCMVGAQGSHDGKQDKAPTLGEIRKAYQDITNVSIAIRSSSFATGVPSAPVMQWSGVIDFARGTELNINVKQIPASASTRYTRVEWRGNTRVGVYSSCVIRTTDGAETERVESRDVAAADAFGLLDKATTMNVEWIPQLLQPDIDDSNPLLDPALDFISAPWPDFNSGDATALSAVTAINRHMTIVVNNNDGLIRQIVETESAGEFGVWCRVTEYDYKLLQR
jgi:hypothetical protein